jgi:hypothetical protein
LKKLKLNLDKINEKKAELENHPILVTNTIQDLDDLKVFMSTHAYAVWDFMSLLKTVQHHIAPSSQMWLPTKGTRTELARMINEIVLCEESDVVPGGGHMSHFDMYLLAMKEIGIDTKILELFIHYMATDPTRKPYHICSDKIAEEFMKTTFELIDRGPHCAAAAFAFGRETVLPNVFQGLLDQLDLNAVKAPKFHYYLQRHIEVDGDDHGPMSLQLVDYFIDNDPTKLIEAERAALDAIDARIRMFDALETKLR